MRRYLIDVNIHRLNFLLARLAALICSVNKCEPQRWPHTQRHGARDNGHDHASAVGNEGDYADADDKRHGDILRMEYNVPLEAANTQMHWYN